MVTPKVTWSMRQDFETWAPVLSDATQEVLSMMVGLNAAPVNDAESPETAEVTAMVGLAGALCGVLSVRCSNALADQIASLMLGVPLDKASENRGDAMGEICNMVAGHFKAKIHGLEDKCLLSVPSVISGDNYTLHSFPPGQRIEVILKAGNELVNVIVEARS